MTKQQSFLREGQFHRLYEIIKGRKPKPKAKGNIHSTMKITVLAVGLVNEKISSILRSLNNQRADYLLPNYKIELQNVIYWKK